MDADMAELVNLAEAAQDRPVIDMDMACEGRAVRQDGVIADLAVMGDMHVRHDPVVIADSGGGTVLHGTATDTAELEDGVVVADLEPGRLPSPFLVLGVRAYG